MTFPVASADHLNLGHGLLSLLDPTGSHTGIQLAVEVSNAYFRPVEGILRLSKRPRVSDGDLIRHYSTQEVLQLHVRTGHRYTRALIARTTFSIAKVYTRPKVTYCITQRK